MKNKVIKICKTNEFIRDITLNIALAKIAQRNSKRTHGGNYFEY